METMRKFEQALNQNQNNLLVLLTVMTLCLGCSTENILKGSTPTPIPVAPSKQMVEANFPVREVWRISGWILTGPEIVIINEKIILASWDRDGRKIVVHEARTGKPTWESQYIRNLNSVHADLKRVYAGSIRYAQAYDLQTGEVIWTGAKQPVTRRGGLFVYPEKDHMKVYDFAQDQIYFLDAETGEPLNITTQANIYFQKETVSYLVPYFCANRGGFYS